MTLTLFGIERQQAALRGELTAAFTRCLEAGAFILGPEVQAFEREVARALGVAHAVGLSSGTDALVCGLQVTGCCADSEVILPAFSFFATAEAVLRVGARPCFVDVNLDDYGMHLDATRAALSPATRAILPVHLYGCPVALDELTALAAARGLAVVEDAAQAFGGSFRGQPLGTWGHAGCFSFFPTKPLGGLGDGGMLVTNDAALAERCRRLRVHGAPGKHLHSEVGGNYRLDALQAAFLRVKLPHVERWRRARAAHFRAYAEGLAGLGEVAIPSLSSQADSAHALFTLRVLDGRRDALASKLAEQGIPSAVYYPRPLHLQPALERFGYRQGQFPNAELLSQQVLSLPLFAELTISESDRVIQAVRSFFR